MRRELKKPRTYLAVFRDIGRKIAGNAELEARFARLLGLARAAAHPETERQQQALFAACARRWSAPERQGTHPLRVRPQGGDCNHNREGLAGRKSEAIRDGHTLAATVDQAVTAASTQSASTSTGYRGHDYAGAGSVMTPAKAA